MTTPTEHAMARQAAWRELSGEFPDRFAELHHEQKHRYSIDHRHGAEDPETIDWWIEPPVEAKKGRAS